MIPPIQKNDSADKKFFKRLGFVFNQRNHFKISAIIYFL